MHKLFRVARSLVHFSCLLALLSGCAGTRLLQLSKPKIREADARNPAVQMIAIWQPAEGRGLDDLPTRGFAGQILFFNHGGPSPVKVNGDVRIYLFDDDCPPGERDKPIHQFNFESAAWNTHFQDSTLGPAYYVFIPYVRKHHYQARCSLRVRLIPADGPTIYSNLVSVTLPGPLRKDDAHADQLAATKDESDAEAEQNSLQVDRPSTAADAQQIANARFEMPAAVASSFAGGDQSPRPLESLRFDGGRSPIRQISAADMVPADKQDNVIEKRLDRMERLIERLVDSSNVASSETSAVRTVPAYSGPALDPRPTVQPRHPLEPGTLPASRPLLPAETHPLAETGRESHGSRPAGQAYGQLMEDDLRMKLDPAATPNPRAVPRNPYNAASGRGDKPVRVLDHRSRAPSRHPLDEDWVPIDRPHDRAAHSNLERHPLDEPAGDRDDWGYRRTPSAPRYRLTPADNHPLR